MQTVARFFLFRLIKMFATSTKFYSTEQDSLANQTPTGCSRYNGLAICVAAVISLRVGFQRAETNTPFSQTQNIQPGVTGGKKQADSRKVHSSLIMSLFFIL